MYERWLQGVAPANAVPVWARAGKWDESQRARDFPTNDEWKLLCQTLPATVLFGWTMPRQDSMSAQLQHICICCMPVRTYNLCVHVTCIHAYYDNMCTPMLLNPYLMNNICTYVTMLFLFCLSNCCVPHTHICTYYRTWKSTDKHCGEMGVFPPLSESSLLVARMMVVRGFLPHHTVPGDCAVCINIAWWVYDIGFNIQWYSMPPFQFSEYFFSFSVHFATVHVCVPYVWQPQISVSNLRNLTYI